MSDELHLLLPPFLTETVLRLDNLSLFVSRAEKRPWTYLNRDACLLDLFNLKNQGVAPITALADGLDVAKNVIYLRADPVHLRADRDKVYLFDADSALHDLTLHEAQQLIKSLNNHFLQDNLMFFASVPHRWYLQLAMQPNLQLSRLSEVNGADIHDYMPEGVDKLQWRSYLNEIQMLLYQNSINEQREMDKKLAVNSVWFWGMGQLPNLPKNNWSQVWSDDILTQGLAQLSAVMHSNLPNQVQTILQQTGNQLIILDKIDLEEFDAIWLPALLKALRQRQMSEIILYTSEGIFNLNLKLLKKWWQWNRLFLK